MEINRNFWLTRINEGWKKHNVLLLSVVRRVGKTLLCKSILVIKKRGSDIITLECKWKSGNFDAANLLIFRKKYSFGENYVICTDVEKSFTKNIKGLKVCFIGIKDKMFSEIL